MRRRLMIAFVGLVAVVLVIAGAGSLVLTRNSARHQAAAQLVTEAQSVTSDKSGTKSLVVLRVVRHVLKLEDARFVRIDLAGVIVSALPPGISAAQLQPVELMDGQTVSGRQGNLVFAAAPIDLSAKERLRLKVRGTVAVVLTREVGDLGPSWGYFILAGGAALFIAALVAAQMSRRMARPLVEAVDATGRIAAGDLESRVPIRQGDYTEFSTLAHSINEMAQSLQDSKTRERDMLLSVSHDLRTPLTSIRGFAEAITDGAVSDTAQAAEVIIAESRRLERLVGDLLDLTKLEASELSIVLRPTDAGEVVKSTTEGFRPMAEKYGVQVQARTPEDDGPGAGAADLIAADPDRLAQLLANLIENAVSFARTAVTVTLLPTSQGTSDATIVVEDDGPGIASADLSRVFQRFYRTDRGPRRQVGSGLGLAIVAELATAMGGTVHAESPSLVSGSGGSRFIVSLPRLRPDVTGQITAAMGPPPQ